MTFHDHIQDHIRDRITAKARLRLWQAMREVGKCASVQPSADLFSPCRFEANHESYCEWEIKELSTFMPKLEETLRDQGQIKISPRDARRMPHLQQAIFESLETMRETGEITAWALDAANSSLSVEVGLEPPALT